MSKKSTSKTTKGKTKREQEPTQEVKAPATDKPDLKGKHKGEAIAKARQAFKALGLTAPKAFDAIEDGTATTADYKALKEQTDALKSAVNALICHFPDARPAREEAAKA